MIEVDQTSLKEMMLRVMKAGSVDSVLKNNSIWFIQDGLLTACTSDDYIVYIEHLPVQSGDLQGPRKDQDFVFSREMLKSATDSLDLLSVFHEEVIVPVDRFDDLKFVYETCQAAHIPDTIAKVGKTPPKLAVNPTRLRKLAGLSHPDYPLDLAWSMDLDFEHVLAWRSGPNIYGILTGLNRDQQPEGSLFPEVEK